MAQRLSQTPVLMDGRRVGTMTTHVKKGQSSKRAVDPDRFSAGVWPMEPEQNDGESHEDYMKRLRRIPKPKNPKEHLRMRERSEQLEDQLRRKDFEAYRREHPFGPGYREDQTQPVDGDRTTTLDQLKREAKPKHQPEYQELLDSGERMRLDPLDQRISFSPDSGGIVGKKPSHKNPQDAIDQTYGKRIGGKTYVGEEENVGKFMKEPLPDEYKPEKNVDLIPDHAKKGFVPFAFKPEPGIRTKPSEGDKDLIYAFDTKSPRERHGDTLRPNDQSFKVLRDALNRSAPTLPSSAQILKSGERARQRPHDQWMSMKGKATASPPQKPIQIIKLGAPTSGSHNRMPSLNQGEDDGLPVRVGTPKEQTNRHSLHGSETPLPTQEQQRRSTEFPLKHDPATGATPGSDERTTTPLQVREGRTPGYDPIFDERFNEKQAAKKAAEDADADDTSDMFHPKRYRGRVAVRNPEKEDFKLQYGRESDIGPPINSHPVKAHGQHAFGRFINAQRGKAYWKSQKNDGDL